MVFKRHVITKHNTKENFTSEKDRLKKIKIIDFSVISVGLKGLGKAH